MIVWWAQSTPNFSTNFFRFWAAASLIAYTSKKNTWPWKYAFGDIWGQLQPKSACKSMQSHQGSHSPFTEYWYFKPPDTEHFQQQIFLAFLFVHENIRYGYSLEASSRGASNDMKTCCGYSLEAPPWGASNVYPQHTCTLCFHGQIRNHLSGYPSYLELWITCLYTYSKFPYHTFARKYVHFAHVVLTWLSSSYHSCRVQKVW